MGQDCCKDTLKEWNIFMPLSVCGGLPKRSCEDVWFAIQHACEKAHHHGEHASGFVLDLEKCYNNLGRLPSIKL